MSNKHPLDLHGSDAKWSLAVAGIDKEQDRGRTRPYFIISSDGHHACIPCIRGRTCFASPFLQTVLAACPLPEWERVASTLRVAHLRSGETLFRSGDVHPFVFFLGDGAIKLVYETAAGDEWIKARMGVREHERPKVRSK